MVSIDNPAEGVQRDVLGECHAEREPPRRDVRPTASTLEGKPEERAVRDVHREPDAAPAAAPGDRLAEHGHVRVVAAERTLVERLL